MRKSFFIIGLFIVLWGMGGLFIQSCKQKSSPAKNENIALNEFHFKERLSDYNFFQEPLRELKANNGLVAYELATPLFTDYAVKNRFIFLPKSKSIQYKTDGLLDFPDSTIIIKNFAYRNAFNKKIMIETRLLAKDPADSKWKVMNYLWNADQTDAVKHIIGAKVPVTLLDDNNNKITTVYQVPNTNDCKRCHINNGVLLPLGPRAANLNIVIPGQMENQLVQWSALGVVEGMPSIEQVARFPNWADSSQFSLDQRARAYLDINCAHCHTKGGDAFNTGLFLEYRQTDHNQLGIMKSPVSAGGGAGGLDYDIVPGDASHSVLLYRMNSTEPGTAMPELARTVIHKEGIELITEWINKMPKKKK